MADAGREVTVVELGPIHAHAVSMQEAVDLIARRAASGRGGFVLTPNLDHVALALRHGELRAAYEAAFLSLADGMPLVAASRLLRLALREKVSGSDLFEPLMARCSQDRLAVYFVGASDDVCRAAEARLRAEQPGVRVLGFDTSFFDLERDPGTAAAALQRARELGAQLVFACVPPMKQLMLHRFEHVYRPALGVGVGSTLAFYAGLLPRAPALVSAIGMEWAYRLVNEPRRLWRRYLLEDPRAIPVFVGMARARVAGLPLERRVQLRLDSLPASDAPVARAGAGGNGSPARSADEPSSR
jgi:N-acetylglucosaminyldiphosphoundecaprenol N-acetyl-beta-D-mannosaminyltransferase